MPSDTVVFQSFRTQGVPNWMNRCMESARHWAGLRGFDYQFIDDRLFDYIPAQYRARTQNKVILSDLARLLVSRELLSQGFNRAVWVDADVVVFNPESWQLPTESNYYFCHELWPVPLLNGVQLEFRANNAVMVFSKGNTFLDFYIDSCYRILESNEELKSWHLGVRFLTGLRKVCPLPLLPNIGMLGALILQDCMTGPKKLLSAYIRSMGVPLVAANCCASVIDQQVNNFLITEKVFDEVVDKSIATKGMVFNRYLPANP